MSEIQISQNKNFFEIRSLMLEALKSDPTAFTISRTEYETKTDFWWDSYLNSYIRTNDSKMLFAMLGNQIAGMIGVVFNTSERANHVANIYWFYVKPEFRGLKIGKKLIDDALKVIAERKGIRKISLTVTSNQKTAIEIYKKYGFEIEGTQKDHLKIDGVFYDFCIMEKHLKG